MSPIPSTAFSPLSTRAFAALGAASILLTGCATTGATFKSGVGDAYPDHPPYYAGKLVTRETPVGLLPVTYQRGATGPANFEPRSTEGSPLATLVADMNRYLDSLGVAPRLSPATPARGTPPDVQFGCIRTAGGDCDPRTEGGAIGRGRRSDMRLAVGRPSKDWIAWAAGAMHDGAVPNALVITLEISDYHMRQTGLRGNKELELGTGYTVALPWLTGVDHPVNVLQLTGAVMSPDGTAVRIGAEGLIARRTGIMAGAIGAQEIITDDEVTRLRSARREDLPGQPLVWQVALRNLVAELTGRTELAMR